jgi:plasmid stabilization system protein ParE
MLHAVGSHPGIREMPCEGHRVFYRLQGDGDLVVLRVFGPGQSREV